MNPEKQHDYSISMLRANLAAILIMVPVAVLQFGLYFSLYGTQKMEFTFSLGNLLLLAALLIVSSGVHELLHGLTWMIFGKQPFSAVKFAVNWKTMTPYAHLKEPLEVNAYRLGGLMPGLLLGICPFLLSLVLGNGALFWFGFLQTSAASGDWLSLWLIRRVPGGTLVADHPTRVGCTLVEA
jgi:hypothetical protein